MNTFQDLGLDARLVKSVEALGFVTPTPIQLQAIPALLEGGRDLVGLAQTGTGKTAAFGLPLLQLIDLTKNYPQALILAPTRELCMQIYNDLQNFSTEMRGFESVPVYGGASIMDQMRKIKRGVHVVVATPGRLIDLLKRKALDLGKVKILVLDEADEMLNMGFKEDIDYILENTPDERNTWLFSATMPREVSNIAKNYMDNPFEITTESRLKGNENIEHCYAMVKARDRYAALKRFVDANVEIFGIIFCRTRMETQEVAEHLMRDGYNADSLHGDLSQVQRDKVMSRYRDRSLQLLVATDVAARGIDVQDVTHVIHYNLPDELENYMHRSGRTARAGKTGMSLAIVHTKDMGRIRQIERSTGRTFKQLQVPNAMEVCEKQLMKLVKKIHDVKVNEKEIEPYLASIYEEFKELDRDALIHRLVSIEFNRFLEYYKNAPDLNADVRGVRGERGESGGGRAYGDAHNRMFVSIGSKDGLDKGKLLRFICDTTGEKGAIFGRIDVQGVYSFVDVEPDRIAAVMAGLNGAMYEDRKVRTELSESKAGSNGGRSSRSSDSRGGGRSSGGRGGESRGRSGGEGRNFGGDRGRGGEGRSYGGDRSRGDGGRERSTERKREMSTEGSGERSFGRDPWKDDKPARKSSSSEGKKRKQDRKVQQERININHAGNFMEC
ncbi:MAG: DEAD/DEAH box helicase [Bacteroidetes bacterium]|nr:DEAD/DEAH box helicase [Bacteroidota bacterium]